MKCMKKIEIYNASLIYRKEIFIQEVFRNVSWEVSSRVRACRACSFLQLFLNLTVILEIEVVFCLVV